MAKRETIPQQSAEAVIATNGHMPEDTAANTGERKINPDKKLIVIHLGGNGVGKGTSGQNAAELLKSEHNVNVVTVSSGDGVRGSKDRKHPRYGKYYHDIQPHRQAMKEGKLIPDAVMQPITRQMIYDALIEDDAQVVIVDGGIRTKEQYEYFKEATLPQLKMEMDIDVIGIHMAADAETAVKRTGTRVRIAEAQGKPVREDDKDPDVVRGRFQTFEEENPPIARALAAEGRLHTISARPTGKEVIGRQVERVIFNALTSQPRVIK